MSQDAKLLSAKSRQLLLSCTEADSKRTSCRSSPASLAAVSACSFRTCPRDVSCPHIPHLCMLITAIISSASIRLNAACRDLRCDNSSAESDANANGSESMHY